MDFRADTGCTTKARMLPEERKKFRRVRCGLRVADRCQGRQCVSASLSDVEPEVRHQSQNGSETRRKST